MREGMKGTGRAARGEEEAGACEAMEKGDLGAAFEMEEKGDLGAACEMEEIEINRNIERVIREML